MDNGTIPRWKAGVDRDGDYLNQAQWKLYDPKVVPDISRNRYHDSAGQYGIPAYVILSARAGFAVCESGMPNIDRRKRWGAQFNNEGIPLDLFRVGRPALDENGKIWACKPIIKGQVRTVAFSGTLTDEEIEACGLRIFQIRKRGSYTAIPSAGRVRRRGSRASTASGSASESRKRPADALEPDDNADFSSGRNNTEHASGIRHGMPAGLQRSKYNSASRRITSGPSAPLKFGGVTEQDENGAERELTGSGSRNLLLTFQKLARPGSSQLGPYQSDPFVSGPSNPGQSRLGQTASRIFDRDISTFGNAPSLSQANSPRNSSFSDDEQVNHQIHGLSHRPHQPLSFPGLSYDTGRQSSHISSSFSEPRKPKSTFELLRPRVQNNQQPSQATRADIAQLQVDREVHAMVAHRTKQELDLSNQAHTDRNERDTQVETMVIGHLLDARDQNRKPSPLALQLLPLIATQVDGAWYLNSDLMKYQTDVSKRWSSHGIRTTFINSGTSEPGYLRDNGRFIDTRKMAISAAGTRQRLVDRPDPNAGHFQQYHMGRVGRKNDLRSLQTEEEGDEFVFLERSGEEGPYAGHKFTSCEEFGLGPFLGAAGMDDSRANRGKQVHRSVREETYSGGFMGGE